jgi:hypothetical protein
VDSGREVPVSTSGEIPHREPSTQRTSTAIAPTTRLGKWAVGLVAAAIGLGVAVATVVPGDSVAAWLVAFAGLGLLLAGVGALFGAIFRRAERALSVYAAAVVLVGGVLFVLLHSLFISD